MGDIAIPVKGGNLPVFVALPERGAPWPGVVVLHDVGGMKEDLRNQARWLAGEGFLAATPNLYFRGAMMKCVFAIARDLRARRGQTYDDIEAVRAWLAQYEGCTGRIGVIGFCMGGGFALLLAPDHGFGAASVNYGGPLPEDAETGAGMPDRRKLWSQGPLEPGRGAAIGADARRGRNRARCERVSGGRPLVSQPARNALV